MSEWAVNLLPKTAILSAVEDSIYDFIKSSAERNFSETKLSVVKRGEMDTELWMDRGGGGGWGRVIIISVKGIDRFIIREG